MRGGMDINQLDQADESACLIAETPTIPDPISIAADLAPTFTFASHQNSIPVIRAIRVCNPTPDALESLRLELTSQPAFLRPKTWTIDSAGSRRRRSSRARVSASIEAWSDDCAATLRCG